MKKKIIGLIVISLLLVGFLSIKYTYSRLNITFTQDLSIISKRYDPLVITNTKMVDDNSYQITLKNSNDYAITFSCEDINSNFNIICSKYTAPANSTTIINVDLDFKQNVNSSLLTPNPNGSGYVTKLGIKITSPYSYPENDPHYVTSGDMIVVELVVTNLVEYITNLANTDTTNLAKDHSNVRYIGANPNNYIYFNNELWRIIGVFDGKVKIMRTTPYNNNPYVFYDGTATGTHTKFKDSVLKTQLNNAFYNSINSNYSSMIVEGTWNVGGLNIWNSLAATTAYNTEISTTIKANVGLISATDYVYATGGSNRASCIGSTHVGNISGCGGENWMKQYATTSGMWTINEFTGQGGVVIIVNTAGDIANNEIVYASAAYPVVYLDESMGFKSGDGTHDNPFKLKTGDAPVVSSYYKDYITNVYINSWGNELSGFAGLEVNSFDKENGALLFDNNTWGIPSGYTIDQVTVYSYNWAELATYYQRDWIGDEVWHARLSNYVFRRQTGEDFDYIGGNATLNQADGSLRFVIIVKPK